MQTGPEYGFGLYVHWPYCTRICPYCDFNVYAAKTRDNEPLVDALIRDLERHRTRLPDHPPLDTIYLGGGTPSLMAPSDLAKIIERAGELFGGAPHITLESNPNEIASDTLSAWREIGVDRLSLGLQALDDDALKFLGRDHDSAAGRRAAEAALRVFDDVSIDLIYARPGQSLAAWEAELSAALAIGAPHLSLYELTIAERTAFGAAAARGSLVPMPDDDQADMYEATEAVTRAAGVTAYEVSNYARAPRYRSAHNAIYWNSGDWMGIGPGAHGRLTIDGQRIATEAARRVNDYVAADGPAEEVLSDIGTVREMVAMGLRPEWGVERGRIEALAGVTLNADKLSQFETADLLTQTQGRIALTAAGRLLADKIAVEICP